MFIWNALFPHKDTNEELLEKQKDGLKEIIEEANKEKILVQNERFVVDQDLKRNCSTIPDVILKSKVKRYVRCHRRVEEKERKIEMFEDFVDKLDDIKSNLKLDTAMVDLAQITETINKA